MSPRQNSLPGSYHHPQREITNFLQTGSGEETMRELKKRPKLNL